MPDHAVAEVRPLSTWDAFGQVALDLERVGVRAQAQPPRQSAHVGIHRETRDAEGGPEHHVGGLAAYPGKLHQGIEIRRHLAVMLRHEGPAAVAYGPGLVAEEARGADGLFQILQRRAREVHGPRVAGEQGRRDPIDALVGALGAEDGRDQELQRAVLSRAIIDQGAMRIGVEAFQAAAYRGQAALFGGVQHAMLVADTAHRSQTELPIDHANQATGIGPSEPSESWATAGEVRLRGLAAGGSRRLLIGALRPPLPEGVGR